ncbi:DNA-(apurinic or apyrimidinic site) endonuclease [Trifolium repens]|jgi:hypothetical protein|nr:DNA-(apurinic or apyrimidinic site) endonuclease [Trifolium repens]
MKLISYNIRGLGGKAKKSDIRKIILQNSPDLVCIQETKAEKLDRRTCTSLWGSYEFDFVFKEADGRSGGLLTIWGLKSFKLISSVWSSLTFTLRVTLNLKWSAGMKYYML